MNDKHDSLSISPLTSPEICRAFAADFARDPRFSDPMLTNDAQLEANLLAPLARPERFCVFGVYRESALVGLFSFLVLREENYLEMLVGLSREAAAYSLMLRHLREKFAGFSADFVFNPKNSLLRDALRESGAEFEPPQRKLVLEQPLFRRENRRVLPLDTKNPAQYLAIHNKDMYWTGERVAAAQDRFRTLVAYSGETAVGYLDVTRGHEENEVYDLFVLPNYRQMGYGRALMERALDENRPSGMMLLVDTDNEPALRLFASMGFRAAENGESITAHLTLAPAPHGESDEKLP